jgi:hypothetical protein
VSPEASFQLLNLVVLPWWGAFLAAPRSRTARVMASHGGIFVALGAIYSSLLARALVGDSGGGFDLAGLQRAFQNPTAFLAGWTHYLAFDLFVGAWIVREALRIDVEARPFLFFTWIAGPIGLAGFLLRRGWKLRSLGQLGDSDLV